MSGNYEQDQDRLLSSTAHTLGSAISLGTQLWMARHKPVKIQVKTAEEDVQNVRQGINLGKSAQDLFQSVQKSEIFQRVARSGGDANKYAHLIMRRAEIDHAVEMMPSQSLSQERTPKKTL